MCELFSTSNEDPNSYSETFFNANQVPNKKKTIIYH